MDTIQFTPKLFTLLRAGYSLSDLKADALAGMTVAVVALPLAMALAIASHASPYQGLVTAVIAGFLISFLGGSRVQIGGPTGAFVVVVAGVIDNHGYDGLLLATLMAGVLLLLFGLFRLGSLIRHIPHQVITGFTAGIAVIIASSQIKDFLGLEIEHMPASVVGEWGAYFTHIGSLQIGALLFGVLALATILLLRRYAPKAPAFLMAVVVCSLVSMLVPLPVETIGSRFGDLPSGLPAPQLPAVSLAKMIELLPSALTIAFLAGIEALLSALVADGMTGFRHRSNQELIGQGVANVASACFGGLPATGAIARTATNIRSGARTPVAGMLHALFLLVFMLVAMDVVKVIPMSALAAILFVVAWGMSEKDNFIKILLHRSYSHSAVLVLTFLLTVLVDLVSAIMVGVVLAHALEYWHRRRNPSL